MGGKQSRSLAVLGDYRAGKRAIDEASRKAWVRAGRGNALPRRADHRSKAAELGVGYQPPPPPPPPPPPEKPPPPDPLLDPGATDAEPTVLASEEPTLRVKPLASRHGLFEPAYQTKPCWPWAAAAAS